MLLLWANKIELRYLDHQVNTSEERRHFSFPGFAEVEMHELELHKKLVSHQKQQVEDYI